jgi:hypothetical protein
VRTFVAVAGLALGCLLLSSCSGGKTKSETGGVTLPSAGSAPSVSDTPAQASQVNVCAFFSEADAQSIMGVPMKRSAKTNPQRNCMYEEATARPNSIGPGTIALTLDQHQTTADEDKAWAEVKEVRHLQAGQKNVQLLTGIGDEAYFTGNSEKGKVGVAGLIVRQGKSDFMLDSMVLEYMASPTAMKSVAKKVADQLK